MLFWLKPRQVFLICSLLPSLYGPFGFAADTNYRPDYVAINTSEQAFTVYYGFQKSQLKTSLEDFKLKTQMRVLSIEELEKSSDTLVKNRIVRNDYPEHDAVGGILKLIKAGFSGDGLGLTWNGGIALTYNDFQHAKKSYEKYRKENTWKKLDPQLDPVNPAHHLRLLDPSYVKQLEGK